VVSDTEHTLLSTNPFDKARPEQRFAPLDPRGEGNGVARLDPQLVEDIALAAVSFLATDTGHGLPSDS